MADAPCRRPVHFNTATAARLIPPRDAPYCPTGEPILVKSRDLPLHWFDKLFRTLGSALLFALWAVRAGAARLLRWDRQAALVFVPAAIYAAQAVIRLIIYQLHVAGGCSGLLGLRAERARLWAEWVCHWIAPARGSASVAAVCRCPTNCLAPACCMCRCTVLCRRFYLPSSSGYIFTPQRFARDNLSHPPHVMSDHILLASAVHGGLASEALLPLLSWRHAGATGAG